jgi:hypothetical protein
MKKMFEYFERFYGLAVWSANGQQWLPLLDDNGRVMAYAPAYQAIDYMHKSRFRVRTTPWGRIPLEGPRGAAEVVMINGKVII